MLAIVTAGCDFFANPAATCRLAAEDYGADFVVAGAFTTTVGRVRTLYSNANGMMPSELPDQASATLCFIDGDLPKAPAPEDGEVQPTFDRAVVVVVDGTQTPLAMGYRTDLDVVDPDG